MPRCGHGVAWRRMTTQPHILIVDDSREIRDVISRYLRANAYRVSAAENAAAARRVLKTNGDRPCGDRRDDAGRGRACALPRAARGERAAGHHADRARRRGGSHRRASRWARTTIWPSRAIRASCLARIAAVLRRAKGAQRGQGLCGQRIHFEKWTLDVGRRELIGVNGVAMALSSGEFRLLVAFLERPKTALSREQLLDLTQGRTLEPFDRSIDSAVSRAAPQDRRRHAPAPHHQDRVRRRLYLRGRTRRRMNFRLTLPLWLEITLAVLVALALSNVVTIFLFRGEGELRLARFGTDMLGQRLSSAAGVVLKAPEGIRADLVRALSTPGMRLSLDATPLVAETAVRDAATEALIGERLASEALTSVRVHLVGPKESASRGQSFVPPGEPGTGTGLRAWAGPMRPAPAIRPSRRRCCSSRCRRDLDSGSTRASG